MLAQRDPEHVELRAVPAAADVRDEAPAADVVDGRALLGDHDRVHGREMVSSSTYPFQRATETRASRPIWSASRATRSARWSRTAPAPLSSPIRDGAEQAELQTGWGCSTPDSSTSPPPPLPIRSLFQRCFVVQNWRPCQPGRLRYLIARAASGPGSNPARVSSSAAAIAAVPAKSWSRAASAPAPGTPSAKSPPFR